MSEENRTGYKALIRDAGSYEIYQTDRLSELLGILEADLAELEKQKQASGPVEKLQSGVSNYWTSLSNLLAQFHLYQLKWAPSQNWLLGEKILRILLNITAFHRSCSKERKQLIKRLPRWMFQFEAMMKFRKSLLCFTKCTWTLQQRPERKPWMNTPFSRQTMKWAFRHNFHRASKSFAAALKMCGIIATVQKTKPAQDGSYVKRFGPQWIKLRDAWKILYSAGHK